MLNYRQHLSLVLFSALVAGYKGSFVLVHQGNASWDLCVPGLACGERALLQRLRLLLLLLFASALRTQAVALLIPNHRVVVIVGHWIEEALQR